MICSFFLRLFFFLPFRLQIRSSVKRDNVCLNPLMITEVFYDKIKDFLVRFPALRTNLWIVVRTFSKEVFYPTLAFWLLTWA